MKLCPSLQFAGVAAMPIAAPAQNGPGVTDKGNRDRQHHALFRAGVRLFSQGAPRPPITR